MSFKLHLFLPSVFMQIRCNFPDISYLSEMQINNFQFVNVVNLKETKSATMNIFRKKIFSF